MKNLVIKRSEWLRAGLDKYVDTNGEEHDWINVECKLYNPIYNKYCCLGLYAKSCGFTNDDMQECQDPVDLYDNVNNTENPYFVGLLTTYLSGNSDIALSLIDINDNDEISNSEREKKIADLFSQINVNVTFED